MPQPTDEKLYEKIKNELFKKYTKPSAMNLHIGLVC